MSGHSKWAKIHRKKGAADAKRGNIFTKLGNLITVAAREGGGDQESNFALRLAVEKARIANMPKDNIERAIGRGTGEGNEGSILEEVTYEMFGPAGSTFIIEAITDNKNRTLSDLKMAAGKNGGNMGGSGSVSWMFVRSGLILIDKNNISKDEDELELEIIDAGASDIIKEGENWEIYTEASDLQKVIEGLKTLELEIKESNLTYIAKDALDITDEETQAKIEKLYSAIDELDDVNNVYVNI